MCVCVCGEVKVNELELEERIATRQKEDQTSRTRRWLSVSEHRACRPEAPELLAQSPVPLATDSIDSILMPSLSGALLLLSLCVCLSSVKTHFKKKE